MQRKLDLNNFPAVKDDNTVRYARRNVIGSRPLSLYHLFVLVYIEICVFMGNRFQAHSLEQSYHPTQPFKQEKHKTKAKICVKMI